MSRTTEEVGRRIAGAEDLHGVVRAMKALAASSIGQYAAAVEALDKYCRTVEFGLSACLHDAAPTGVEARARGRISAPVGAIVFGSDQGLVGRFNEVLMEFAAAKLRSLGGNIARVWAVGERIEVLASDAQLARVEPMVVPASVDAISRFVGDILVGLERSRTRGEIVDVYLFHNSPTPRANYEPVVTQLLPLDGAWQAKLAATRWPAKRLPEVVDGAESALPAFIRGYLFVLLFRACAESLMSENASRLGAMQRAEKNIETILEDLARTFHRTRQASIDEELFDVIAGCEALSRWRP